MSGASASDLEELYRVHYGRFLRVTTAITGDEESGHDAVQEEFAAPNGTVGVLRVGPRVRGYHCWRVDFGTGPSPGQCVPPIHGGPKIAVDVVQPAGRDLFVVGSAHEVVSRLRVELPDETLVASPAAGHFVVAIPRRYLSAERRSLVVRGIDRQGHRVQRQRAFFRLRS